MQRRQFAYALTGLYVVAVGLVYLLVNYLPPNGQLVAILLGMAILLIITGATLIAVYALIVEQRNRYDHLTTLLTLLTERKDPPSGQAP